jgi:hypothetical protein
VGDVASEPSAVAGGCFDAVIGDVERDGAGVDGEQLKRVRAVRFAGA